MSKERKLVPEERETVCRTSDADDTWEIVTASPKYIRKLEKLGYTPKESNIYGYLSFTVRDGGVSFRGPKKKLVSKNVGKGLLKDNSSVKSAK